MRRKFPIYRQLYSKDCGPSCLKAIAKYYNKVVPIEKLLKLSKVSRLGSNITNLSKAAENIGFRSLSVKINLRKLERAPLPCILFWDNEHFVVLYKIKKGTFYISDPSLGLVKYKKNEFIKRWMGSDNSNPKTEGVAMLLEVTPALYEKEYSEESHKLNFNFFKNYFKGEKKFVLQLILGLIVTSLIQASFPYLTQSLVDFGINNQNLDFIYLILFAQLFLFIGKTSVEIIRDWILIFISTRFKVSLVSNFIMRLMKFPISFFDNKLTGDILQRIKDIDRIKQFTTFSTMNLIFGSITILISATILAIYNLNIFLIFIVGTFLYFLWFTIFLKKREILDEEIFRKYSTDRSKIIELVDGMQEIQLNNAQQRKRWGWEKIQLGLFNLEIKLLKVRQAQNIGTTIINEVKNISIIFYSASLVMKGQISLGIMLAIMFIIGQLNSPISSLLHFIRNFQDATLSYKRISDLITRNIDLNESKLDVNLELDDEDFVVENLSFTYPGKNIPALVDIDFTIEKNKTTAIVGKSGSGKTTLLKLLLKFYQVDSGQIKYGNYNIENIHNDVLRDQIGVVNQEGYIFNDTVANNITLSDEKASKEKLLLATKISNLENFVNEMPLGFNTLMGTEGLGISTGEKQRILIARALYKNPKVLFFDEATSSLDTQNEKEIVDQLEKNLFTKTKLIIAHRLSTVENAHLIVVLDKGKIVEKGNHKDLIKMKGFYYELIKNQLELGK